MLRQLPELSMGLIRFTFKLLLILSTTANGKSVTITDDKHSYLLGTEILYFEDLENQYSSIDSIATIDTWTPHIKDTLNFGFSGSTYWAKVSVVNKSLDLSNFVLEFGYPLLDKLDVYVRTKEGTNHFALGDSLAFTTRPIEYHNFLVPITIDSDSEAEILLRFSNNGPVILPATLWTYKEFVQASSHSILVYGIYFGIMVAMIFYNLFLYSASLTKSYIYYGLRAGSL